jgi:hypothetical protein
VGAFHGNLPHAKNFGDLVTLTDVERSVVTAGATKSFSFLGTICSAENQELLERRAVPSAAWREHANCTAGDVRVNRSDASD